MGNCHLVHCWWEGKLVQLLRKMVWRLLKQPSIDLPYDPSSLLLGIHLNASKQGQTDSVCQILPSPTFMVARSLSLKVKETKYLLGE